MPFLRAGYEKASRSFVPADLDVNLSGSACMHACIIIIMGHNNHTAVPISSREPTAALGTAQHWSWHRKVCWRLVLSTLHMAIYC